MMTNICIHCKKEEKEEHVKCQEKFRWRVNNNICVYCGDAPARTALVSCQKCDETNAGFKDY